MSTLAIANVRIFDPGRGIDARDRTVLVRDGRIESLDAPSASADLELDGGGALVVPGLIDLRVHFCEPGGTKRESIETGVRAAAKGGFTTVVVMPTTEPTIDRPEVVELIMAKAREAGSTRVLVAGAMSVARKGERLSEMARLSAAGCVAFTDADLAVADSQLLRYALETANELGVPVFTHAEDVTLSLGGVMHEGYVATRLGLTGVPATAETVGVARDLAVAELTGARLHLAHLSTSASIDLVRQAKKRGVRVTAEACPLHMLLSDEAVLGYETQAKVFPPLRTASDVEAVVHAVLDGTIDAVASDHLPRTHLEKNTEFDNAAPGAIGLESALGVVLGQVGAGRLTLERAITALTRGPAQVLGREDLGRLEEGGPADMVLIDHERQWLFSPEEVRSRSHNSPLFGRTLQGRVLMTIAGGRVTHRDEALR